MVPKAAAKANAAATMSINIYFHIVTKDSTVSDGNIL